MTINLDWERWEAEANERSILKYKGTYVSDKVEKQNIEVLLFDDDLAATEFVEQILDVEVPGVKVHLTKVATINEALDSMNKTIPDVILASIISNKNAILRLIQSIRDIYSEIPIIVIGAAGSEELALEAVKMGAYDCIFRETLDRSRLIPSLQYAIERRKIYTEALRLHTKQISATIESVSDAILICGSNRKVLFANKAAEQIFWKSAKELIGKKAPLNLSPGKRYEHRFKTPTGDEIVTEVTTNIVPWDEGEAGFCVTIHDVTDHNKIQEELKGAAKLKDEFIAHMSHELRTPMNGIIGMTSLLLQNRLPDEIESYVQTIRSSGENMLSIINDLLDLSKIEAGKLEIENNKFNPQILVEETLAIFGQVAMEKKILLLTNLNDNLPVNLISDASRIRQILANLVSNAMKFTDKGSVSVNINFENNKLEISVIDTGIGIKQKDQKHLFQPFTQLSSDPKRNVGGTGLGLAISRKLAQALGGNIECHSKYGRGAEFRFSVNAEPIDANLPAIVRKQLNKSIGIFTSDRLFYNAIRRNLDFLGCKVERLNRESESFLTNNLLIIDNPIKFDEQQQSILRNVRENYPGPILIVGGSGVTKTLLESMKVSSVKRYPFKTSEFIHYVEDLLLNKNQVNFYKNELKRQEKISHRYENYRFDVKRVLIEEDNIINQKVAVMMLQQLGVDSDVVANGKEALDAARQYNYDAILMDCRMPIMDGYESAIEIRKLSDHYKNIPIIAVSANAQSEKTNDDESNEILMDDYLAKPITIEDLKHSFSKFFKPTQLSLTNKSEPLKADQKLAQDTFSLVKMSVIESLERVSQRVGTNLLADVLALFEKNSPDLIKQLREAAKNENAKGIESLAHKLKGSARNLGAINLGELCEKLENQGEVGVLDGANELINQIEDSYNETLKVLKNHQSTTSSGEASRAT